MSTYTQLYYHIIFAPKHRGLVLMNPHRQRLYQYFWRVLENNKCRPFAINGMEDHVHFLAHVHQTVSIAEIVKTLKVSSSDFIKRERLFPQFQGWQDGYAAFTVSADGRQEVHEYILGQEEHHRNEGFIEELKRMLTRAGVNFDERYLG